ncbi:hypothetical protein RBWH47_02201 [Rhodopirellula baltica WH47]|uniref:Uncharacterized protein n=1 Tax=Rhodopirellula baltica WH47 TaxID=991778 RepID=F2AWH1_RHOBT|nr:hypothetical protein RBWH47_02201 [Rhodopirellula baltica WH47]
MAARWASSGHHRRRNTGGRFALRAADGTIAHGRVGLLFGEIERGEAG